MRSVGTFVRANAALTCAVLGCAVFLTAAAADTAAAEQHRRIFFLESLAPTQFAAIRTIDGFQKRLAQLTSENFDVFIDYMDLERLPGQAHIDSTVRYLSEKYRQASPDLLIPLGRAAVPFMIKYRDVIAPGIPVIMADMPASSVAELRNAVWVATEYNFAKTLALAQRLQPGARHLALIAGASAYDRLWVDDARRVLEPERDTYDIRYLVGLRYDDMLQQASRLPPDTIVLMSFVFTDGDGVARSPPDVGADVARVSPAPVYSPVSSFFGRGIVGGFIDSFEAHGTAAADLAFKILSGKPLAELPHQTEPLHRDEIDARRLEHWGLSTSKLPADAVVSFRTPSIWEQDRNLLLGAAAIFTLQTVLLAFLLVQRRMRKNAEAEAAEQRSEVAHLMRVSTLGELSGTIAHEINQPLAAILSNAQAALHLLAQRSPDLEEVRDALNDIVHEDNRAGDVIGRVRKLLKKGERGFERIHIDELVKSTIALLNSELIARRIVIEADLGHGLPPIFVDPVQLQQVLLNLFMNAMDAMALTEGALRRIKVSTQALGPSTLEVRIRDRGPGIKPEAAPQLFKPFYTSKDHGLGLGLTICSTIVQAHGGKLGLVNHPDRGAVALLTLPTEPILAATK